MKITDIKWEHGKKYKVYDSKWEKECYVDEEELKVVVDYNLGYGEARNLCEFISMKDLLEVEFEEIVDWSKVPVDSKVYAEDSCGDEYPRHFAKYQNGSIFCWTEGGTSWSCEPWEIERVEHCRLAE